jgi:hypothetical protein
MGDFKIGGVADTPKTAAAFHLSPGAVGGGNKKDIADEVSAVGGALDFVFPGAGMAGKALGGAIKAVQAFFHAIGC